MKRTKSCGTLLALLVCFNAISQTITPVIKASFGVEADLKRNYFNGVNLPNNDDWFPNPAAGSGIFVIDTTGAAAINAQYVANPASRTASFTRPMNYPLYSIVNNKFMYDALYVRDHNKYDSTAFLISNKNGQSPQLWNGGTSSVPVKNDLNDVMIHVRRDGPNLSDSLWFFAGVSVIGTNGSRYIDFELYQTEIYFSQADGKFYNYGPDAGHTSWQFDSLGNVTKPGDVIFSAEFGTASLTLLQARIWIDKNSMTNTPNPVPFNWGGIFDGDGAAAQYGYASILPKTNGDFYSGVQCDSSTWAGPFGFIDPTDISVTNYSSRNYMEIAVNMTKIGLDPYEILGTGGCNLTFRRFMTKTRTSTSFTSTLTDFVGPFRIAQPAAAVILSDSAMFCANRLDTSVLTVQNPVPTSIYSWTTTNGHILTSPAVGPSISVDQPGTYIVTQTLFAGCNVYSSDTIKLVRDDKGCTTLAADDLNFRARNINQHVSLNWVSSSPYTSAFEIERSIDGRSFTKIGSINAVTGDNSQKNYEATDDITNINSETIYYRLKLIKTNSSAVYSKIVRVKKNDAAKDYFTIFPNPANNYLQVTTEVSNGSKTTVRFFNSMGSEVSRTVLNSTSEKISLEKFPPGMYLVQISSEDGREKTQKKLIVAK